MPRSSARQRYFDKNVHLQPIKDCISGSNEDRVIAVLENIGYKLAVDFVRQHPIGCRFVLDFAFVNEQVAIEVDGKTHLQKKQRRIDRMRDDFLYLNNWVVIRVKDWEFFGYKASFWKYLIQEVVEERRFQYATGRLFPIEVPEFDDRDYEEMRTCISVRKGKGHKTPERV